MTREERATRRVLIPPIGSLVDLLPPPGRLVALAGATMGTGWSVRLVVPPAAEARAIEAGIIAELSAIVAEMSHFEPESALTRFNRAPAGSRHRLPARFATVLRHARAVAEASGGAFDPTMGPLVDLWGFGAAPRRDDPPSDEAIRAAWERCGHRRLRLEGDHLRQPGGLGLDLSGIAKGWAVDAVARLLDSRGVASHLVEIGGELRGKGVKPDGSPWWVGIDPPAGRARADRRETVVALHRLAVATSADERRLVHDGRSHGHTTDPRTGRPLADGPAAVTVLHQECVVADAWATALMVLGIEAGMALAIDHGLAASFLTDDGGGGGLKEATSPAFAAMLA